jgi:hypothetical protein
VAERRPRGRFDAEMTFRQTGADHRQAGVVVRPQSISFLRGRQRVTLDQTTGTLTVRPERIDVDQLAGRLGSASFLLDGDVRFKPERVADLAVAAEGKQVADDLHAALPEPVSRLLRMLKVDGRFKAKLEPVRIMPDARAGQAAAVIRGEVRLDGARADLGVAITDIDGTLTFDVKRIAGRDWPVIHAKLDARRMTVRQRRLTDVTATLQSVADSDVLAIRDVRGRLYDGTIAGQGSLWLKDHKYQFRLAMNDVDLDAFVYRGDPPDDPNSKMTGDLAASFSVEGDWTRPGSMRARGRIAVEQGRMYRLPLALGLLQITHLSLPTTRSFERADVRYYIKDRKVVFERLVLESPHMRMAGDGSMDSQTEQLDITLTSSNPSAIDLGPVSEMVDAVRDQFVTIRVTGTLADPQRDVQQFSGLTKAWRDVFGDGVDDN